MCIRDRQETVLSAFEKDTFEAKKLALDDAKKARAPMEEQVKFLAQLVPILRSEQRDKLAKQMQKSEARNRHRGPGGDRGHEPAEEEDEQEP